jgi:hypothetical protein
MFDVSLGVPVVRLERVKHIVCRSELAQVLVTPNACLIFKKRALMKTQAHRGPMFSLVELSMRGIM